MLIAIPVARTQPMLLKNQYFRPIRLGAALLLPVMINGCASHVRVVRVYDPYGVTIMCGDPTRTSITTGGSVSVT
jgi:hypothetical protein